METDNRTSAKEGIDYFGPLSYLFLIFRVEVDKDNTVTGLGRRDEEDSCCRPSCS